jgi:hypothetical protein
VTGKQVWLIVHDATGQFLKSDLQVTPDARAAEHFGSWQAAVSFLSALAGPNFPQCHVTDSFLHVVPEARAAGERPSREDVIFAALKRNKENRARNSIQRELSNEAPPSKSAVKLTGYGVGKFGVILLASALLWSHHADAHPRHHHCRHYAVQQQSFFSRLFHAPTVDSGSTARPRDCYGIAWCGCWLRHELGVASTSFNLAIHWLTWGHASGPQVGAVAVWRHHVGRIVGVCDGGYLLQSGNDGDGNRAGTHCRNMRGVVGYRAP